MSLDNEQQVDNDDIDLGQLFRSIWFYKFSLLIFIILSVPTSIVVSSFIKPKYEAETVFEKPSKENGQSNASLLNGSQGIGFLNLLSGGQIGIASDSFFS